MNDNSQTKSRFGSNTSYQSKAKAMMLAPLNIIKKDEDDPDSRLFKVDNGSAFNTAESDSYLEKRGIILNKNKSRTQTDSSSMPQEGSRVNASDHDMSVESFHPSNMSIDPNTNMSVLQESTRKSFSKMSISGESSANLSKNSTKTTALVEDEDGFKVPASKNMTRGMVGQRAPNIKAQKNMINHEGIRIENPGSNPAPTWDDNQPMELPKEEQKKDDDDKNEIKLEDLKYVGELGSGSQGHVKKMTHKPTSTPIALKIVDLHTDDNFLKALKTELNTLQECNSDYIVKCYGAFLNAGSISIALEYMDKGSLADLLKKVGTISEPILGMITYQVLKGLEYLHKNMKVIHRDIKPSNLLLNSEGQVKIADFGVSGKIEFTLQYKSTWVGTLPYMSPERCRGDKYNFDTDLWSLGLVILECALGRYPYADLGSDQSKLTFFDLVDILSTKPAPKLPDNYSPAVQDFVSICLRKEPGTRTTATELLKHNFVKKFALVSRKNFKGWIETI
jgi:hypothetical protein